MEMLPFISVPEILSDNASDKVFNGQDTTKIKGLVFLDLLLFFVDHNPLPWSFKITNWSCLCD